MSTQATTKSFWRTLSPIQWGGFLTLLAVIIWALKFYECFDKGTQSAIDWILTSWVLGIHQDFSHGWMIPFISAYMLVQAFRKNEPTSASGSLHGLWILILGALVFLISVRTFQVRIALGSIPFLLTGTVWCYWGWAAARRCAFPFFYLWLLIPHPVLQQATVGMQIIATQLAHHFVALCGIQTIVEGTSITFATGNWDSFQIAEGCSGMRSLMALFMLSCAWGYLADKLSLWKRITLALSAIPLSIIANAFRVGSIFICAEYINPAFASKTWHDWSGLLFFFPASLLGLTLLHGLLAQEIPFLKRRKTIVTRSATYTGKEEQCS